MGGPIRAGCLGEEAEKTGKGTGRERIWHMTKSTDADRQQPDSDGDRTHSTCAQCC